MSRPRRIAINTGGGDAPGLNAVIRAATLAALERGWEVWGIRHGYRGLIEPSPDGLVRLDRDKVRGIVQLGGTILGTVNRGDPFNYPTEVLPAVHEPVAPLPSGGAPSPSASLPPGSIAPKLAPMDRSEELVRRFRELRFDALIAAGGDGSMRIANALRKRGLPRVIGVPKTIDNDVCGTDLSFGFDTAVGIATEAIDRLHTTAEAHERIMVVEVMGRHAGWIALAAGVAGTADVILMPEIPFRYEPIVEKIQQREARGRHFSIVVVAEGAAEAGGEVTIKEAGDRFRGVAVLGGLAERVAKELAARTGKEARSIVLGHLQRGGTPTTSDRLLALRFGAAAVRFLAAGAGSGMVALREGRIELVDLDEVAGKTKLVPVDSDTVVTAREMGICFGDEPPGHFAAP
ncbi:MAG: ATP-dependent 6-phosphofructokinase [Polyangiaceae bacterium]|nr:ATP-dependent 6-phosphofructokinase [Polyangiaceae bacterium]